MTFEFLDDICLAVTAGDIDFADLPATQADALGPLLELHHTVDLANSADASWLASQKYGSLIAAKAGMKSWYFEGLVHLGFISVRELQHEKTAVTDLCMRAKRAAVGVGFSSSDAPQIVAAIMEFYSNVVEHSGYIDSGYVAFSSTPGRFEFIVADTGVGVLESLKTNPKFAHLQDAGSALELALQEGVSRHPDEPERGRGFRPLFVGLANISQAIRFRSGDHCRELERQSDGTIPAYTKQKSTLPGFFSTVTCTAGK